MIEVRFHGRGGQGAVTSAELIALAAIAEGKYAQSFPSFGPERRGAPVLSFVRISDQPIRIRSSILQPDVVVVLDPALITVGNALSGLKKDGTIIINTQKSVQEIREAYNIKNKIVVVNATKIARETLGLPITNTTMLGALVRVTDVVKLESLIEPLKHRFGRIAEKNINACQRAYQETVMEV